MHALYTAPAKDGGSDSDGWQPQPAVELYGECAGTGHQDCAGSVCPALNGAAYCHHVELCTEATGGTQEKTAQCMLFYIPHNTNIFTRIKYIVFDVRVFTVH